jgi:hypothetical protein
MSKGAGVQQGQYFDNKDGMKDLPAVAQHGNSQGNEAGRQPSTHGHGHSYRTAHGCDQRCTRGLPLRAPFPCGGSRMQVHVVDDRCAGMGVAMATGNKDMYKSHTVSSIKATMTSMGNGISSVISGHTANLQVRGRAIRAAGVGTRALRKAAGAGAELKAAGGVGKCPGRALLTTRMSAKARASR